MMFYQYPFSIARPNVPYQKMISTTLGTGRLLPPLWRSTSSVVNVASLVSKSEFQIVFKQLLKKTKKGFHIRRFRPALNYAFFFDTFKYCCNVCT